jgi:mono/diheme cytochrome c family protein
MFKRYLLTVFVLAFALTGLLAACGSSAVATSAPTATLPPSQVIVEPTTAALPTEILATVAVETTAPTSTATTQSVTGVSFANDVLPILQANCSSCHDGSRPSGGFSVANYQTVMTGSNNGPVIVPNNAQGSLLIQLISSGQMPRRSLKLSDMQIQIIIDWINAGALDN